MKHLIYSGYLNENILSEICNTKLCFRLCLLNSNKIIWRILYFRLCLFFVSTLPAQSRRDSRLREELKISDHMNIGLIILVWFETKYHVDAPFVKCYRNIKYIRIMLSIIFVGHSANYCIDCLVNAVIYGLYKELHRLVKLLS